MTEGRCSPALLLNVCVLATTNINSDGETAKMCASLFSGFTDYTYHD